MVFNGRSLASRFSLCLFVTSYTAACSTTRDVVQGLDMDGGSKLIPSLSLHKPLASNLEFIGSVRGWSGTDANAMSLMGFREASAGGFWIPLAPQRPAEEFRYGDIKVVGHTESAGDERFIPSRSFSANYRYQSADASLLWSTSSTRRWFADFGLLLRYDRLAIDVDEVSPSREPSNFNVTDTAVSLSGLVGVELRLSKPLTIKLGLEAAVPPLSEVALNEIDLNLIYSINERVGINFGIFFMRRSDKRQVSPIDLSHRGFQVGLSIYL